MSFLFALLLLSPSVAHAHPVTMAYMDFRPATQASPLLLTVAIHPHQALLVAGLSHGEEEGEGFADQIPALQAEAELIGAYLKAHMQVTAEGKPCIWEPTRVDVPDTELGALADGVSLSAPLVCEGNAEILEIESTIFTEAFKSQQTVVRLETPEGFAERLVLDKEITRGKLALSEEAIAKLYPPDPSVPPQAPLILQLAGWAVFLAVVVGGIVLAYRTNIASPKE